MSDKLIEKAVASIAEQADGNGVTPRDIAVESHVVEWHTFRHCLSCSVEVTREEQAGLASVRYHELAQQPQGAKALAEQYARSLADSDEPLAKLVAQVRKVPPFEDAVIDDFDARARAFAAPYPCPTCRGAGEHVCGSCSGSGRKMCLSCSGGYYMCSRCGASGRVDGYSCPCCGGGGRITCQSCGGSQQVRCPTCSGGGRVGCGPCNASGRLYVLHVVKLVGRLKSAFDWADVPDHDVDSLEHIGLSALPDGHVQLQPTEVRPRGGQVTELWNTVSAPFGELTVRIHDVPYRFTVAGLQAVAVPVGPFVEKLAESGLAALAKAAGGRAARARKQLLAALEFDLVRRIVSTRMATPVLEGEAELRAHYPSLHRNRCSQLLGQASQACTKVLKARSRRSRRAFFLLIAAPAVLAWFGLGLRRRLGVEELGWEDAALVLCLALLGTWVVSSKVRETARRILYWARNDRAQRWRQFRKRRTTLPRPAAGCFLLLLGTLAASLVSMEIGQGLLWTSNPTWAQMREPYAREVEPYWEQARNVVDPRVRDVRRELAPRIETARKTIDGWIAELKADGE